MKSLVCLGAPILYPKSSPWLKTRPNHSHLASKSLDDHLYISASRRNTVIIVRAAKGFGGAVAIPNKKPRKEDVPNGDGGEGDEDELPEEVFNRIIARILVCVGTPMVLGAGMLSILSKLKDEQIWGFPLWLPYLTIVLGFGTSAFGIAYGALSTSWDPDRKGSFLGWEEAQKNWPELWEED